MKFHRMTARSTKGSILANCSIGAKSGAVVCRLKGPCRKLAIGRVEPRCTLPSRFVNLLKSEEAREQIVLIVDGPASGEAEAFPQPQHRFESERDEHPTAFVC